jgi:hypothetical protein
MNKVIINVSTGGYIRGANRLRDTLSKFGYDGDLLFFDDESQINSPKHIDNPYAFKTFAFNHVLNLGYKKIIWLDSSVYAIKPLDSMWKKFEEYGFLMQYAGHECGTWANDNCLNYFGINRDESMKMPMYGNAGFLALDFELDVCNRFLSEWHQSALDGVFKGKWDNKEKTESQDERCMGHRHDMVCGSIIANKLGMNNLYLSAQEVLQYAAPEDEPLNDTIILKAQGI